MAAARRNRRRRRNRGLLGPLFKVLCVAAVLVALTFGVTVFFEVETVTVNGTSRYTPEEVVEASGIGIGDNLYRFNKNHISNRILQTLPYVEGVNINRKPPSTIVITVTEFSAVARIEPPADSAPAPAPAAPEPSSAGSASSSGSTSGASPADASGSAVSPDGSAGSSASGSSSGSSSSSQEEEPLEIAREAWLISPPGPAGCKLLEPAPEGSSAIPVTGLGAVSPRAGTMLQVAPSEQDRLDALEGLLGEITERGELGKVNSISLSDTTVTLAWMGRFQVKMPLNSDFNYKMRALEASIEKVEAQRGKDVTGILDMTDEEGPIRYSPYEQ